MNDYLDTKVAGRFLVRRCIFLGLMVIGFIAVQIFLSNCKYPEGHVVTQAFLHKITLINGLSRIKDGFFWGGLAAVFSLALFLIDISTFKEMRMAIAHRVLFVIATSVFIFFAVAGARSLLGKPYLAKDTIVSRDCYSYHRDRQGVPRSTRRWYRLDFEGGISLDVTEDEFNIAKAGDMVYLVMSGGNCIGVYDIDEYRAGDDVFVFDRIRK